MGHNLTADQQVPISACNDFGSQILVRRPLALYTHLPTKLDYSCKINKVYTEEHVLAAIDAMTHTGPPNMVSVDRRVILSL